MGMGVIKEWCYLFIQRCQAKKKVTHEYRHPLQPQAIHTPVRRNDPNPIAESDRQNNNNLITSIQQNLF